MIDVPVLVKDALRSGAFRKNYRFLVLNDDGTTDFTIDNQNLVSESVNIDERMCSGDTIKFGLCEGSSLEFQYFGKDNITGRQIKAFIDVDYGEALPYSIPMGFFTVKNCSRQASTGIIKVTAYNKLQSTYLDEKANEQIIALATAGEDGENTVSYYYILNQLLKGYNIEEYNIKATYPDIEPTTYLPWWLDSHAAAVYELVFPLYNAGGNFTQSYLHIKAFAFTPYPYSATDPDILNNYGYSLVNGAIGNKIRSLYTHLGTLLDSRYVKEYDGSGIASLRDFLLNKGYLEWRANMSSTSIYPDFDSQKHVVGGRVVSYNFYYDMTSATEDYLSDLHLENGHDYMYLPYSVTTSTSSATSATMSDFETTFLTMHSELEWFFKDLAPDMPDVALQRFNATQAEALPDVTLRELQSATYETVCQFGQLDRTTDLFSGVELNRSRLLPADTLYPSNTLYPNGAQSSANKSMYSKLWADEGNIHKWRYLIITYKAMEDGQEVEKTLQRTVNADGTDDYNMSDNWLFKNLVWTAEDVGTYADAMVAKMQDITWFPFEMWCAGLPYLETGDEIEIPLGEETYTSYVLQRQLKGIQNLQDTYINGTLDIF